MQSICEMVGTCPRVHVHIYVHVQTVHDVYVYVYVYDLSAQTCVREDGDQLHTTLKTLTLTQVNLLHGRAAFRPADILKASATFPPHEAVRTSSHLCDVPGEWRV